MNIELYSTEETKNFLENCKDDLIHLETEYFGDELISITPFTMSYEEYFNYCQNGGIWGYHTPKEWLTLPYLTVEY